jgi:hypothetical protein
VARPEVVQEADRLRMREYELTSAHRTHFAPAAPKVPERPAPVDVGALVAARTRAALKGVSLFKRSERAKAKEAARVATIEEARLHDAEVDEWHRQAAAAVMAEWDLLAQGDPQTVIRTLDEAFADNSAPATCVDAGLDDSGGFATCVMVCGPQSDMPARKAATTPTGKLTVKARTKTEIADLYVRYLGSTVMATAKEAFAVSPATSEVNLVVLRKDPGASSPSEYLAPVYTGTYSRAATERYTSSSGDVVEEMLRADGARLNRKGAAKEVALIDISGDAALVELVNSFSKALLGS